MNLDSRMQTKKCMVREPFCSDEALLTIPAIARVREREKNRAELFSSVRQEGLFLNRCRNWGRCSPRRSICAWSSAVIQTLVLAKSTQWKTANEEPFEQPLHAVL